MRGPIELLQHSWNIYKEHWKLFLSIFAVPGLVMAFLDYALAVPPEDMRNYYTADGMYLFGAQNPSGFLLVLAITIIVSLFLSLAMYKAVIAPHGMTAQEAYRFALENFFPYAVVSFLTAVIVSLGFIALIIPGVILAVWFSFGYFALLEEGRKGTEALKASREYVRGHWWPVFGRFAAFAVAVILLSIAVGMLSTLLSAIFLPGEVSAALSTFITSAIAMPLAIGYSYLMYQDLKKLKSSAAVSAPVSSGHEEAQPM